MTIQDYEKWHLPGCCSSMDVVHIGWDRSKKKGGNFKILYIQYTELGQRGLTLVETVLSIPN